MTNPSVDVVVTDYGGVLGNHHQDPAESTLASILQVDRIKCRFLLSERSEQGAAIREGRTTEDVFWSTVLDLAGCNSHNKPSYTSLSRLWAETYAVNRDVLSILNAVRRQTPVGVLTNIDRARSDYLLNVVGLLKHVDIYLPSYRFGAIKPKDALWRLADAEIKATFGNDTSVLYIDDRVIHVEACATVGWKGVLYNNTTDLITQLKKYKLLPNEVLNFACDGDHQ